MALKQTYKAYTLNGIVYLESKKKVIELHTGRLTIQEIKELENLNNEDYIARVIRKFIENDYFIKVKEKGKVKFNFENGEKYLSKIVYNIISNDR